MRTSTSSPCAFSACRRLLRARRAVPFATVMIAALGATAVASATPAPVPCTSIGAGKYACDWYPPGDGAHGGALVVVGTTTVGYLHQGRNWIVCQQRGGEMTNAAGNRNHWFGWTTADNGRTGWASALEARGGQDDGPFAGAPDCRGSHGPPPAWSGVWGSPPAGDTPPAPVPLPPTPGPAVPTVTVISVAYANSTPYVDARRRTPIAAGVHPARCEARAQSAGPYRNPWWTQLSDGTWVNNSFLRGGVKMGIGDCAAPPDDARAAPTSCPQRYAVFGLRGSGQDMSGPFGMGDTVGPVTQRIVDRLGGRTVRAVSIPYAAISVDVIAHGNLGDFLTSMRGGQDLLVQEVERTAARCSDARIAIIGYSQGAGAASEALRALSPRARRAVRYAVLIADPYSRSGGGDDVVADLLRPDLPPRRDGDGILGARQPDLPASRVADVCFRNDLICDAPRGRAAKLPAALLSAIHSQYKHTAPLLRVLGSGAARALAR